jgi:mannitol-1-phosphate 5-dehydrogenase
MKQAVIFGAGNIGRGFIGQLFSESGYEVTFVDVDRPLLDTLNARGRYTIRLVTNEQTEEVTVGPVRALRSGDLDAVAEAVSRAEIGATAVGAGVLKHIAPAVAAGIARRAQLGVSTPFNLIICENLHGAAAIFREMALTALRPEHHAYLALHVGFVDTVIARMVPPLTPELRAQDPSLIIVEPYKELPVDRDGFVGEPPAIVGMIPFSPFAFFTDRKLYIHNAGHAVLGYLGYLAGYEYGYEALADDEIYFRARGAMEESALALVRKYRPAPQPSLRGGGRPDEAISGPRREIASRALPLAMTNKGLPGGQALLANIEDLLHRFGNRTLGDTILRLGRDPVRKLAHSDRLVGAALNALAQGVTPPHLVTGIAAGLRFAHSDDPVAQDVQKMLRERGIEYVLREVCGLGPDERLTEMVIERYRTIKNGR